MFTLAAVLTATFGITLCAENPHYFAGSNGKPLILLGDYTWGTFSDPDYDFDAMFETLQRQGLNLARVWLWPGCDTFPDPINRRNMVPYLRTGPGMALDGKPKYDLARFDASFFSRLQEVCHAARKRGIVLQLIVFDAWPIKHKHLWKLHAFHRDNNVNHVDGDLNNTGKGDDGKNGYCSMSNPGANAHQKLYAHWVVDAVRDFDNVIFEIANENYYSADWERDMAEYIHDCEKARAIKHLVMPLDLPNHDFGHIKTYDIAALHANLVKARAIKQPVIYDTDGIGNPDDATVRKAVWTAFVSGGNFDYLDDSMQPGTEYKGDVRGTRREALRKQLGALVTFARGVPFWKMEPTDTLVKQGTAYAFASPDRVAVYLPEGGNVSLDLTAYPGTWSGRWYDPRQGKYTHRFTAIGGEVREFAAPGDEDWVMRLSKRAEHARE